MGLMCDWVVGWLEKKMMCAWNGMRMEVLPVAVGFDFLASSDDGLVLWLFHSRGGGFVAPAFSAGDCGRMARGMERWPGGQAGAERTTEGC